MGDAKPFDIEEGGRMQKEKRCFEVIPKLCGGQLGMSLNESSCGKSKAGRLRKKPSGGPIAAIAVATEPGRPLLSLQGIVRCTNCFELSPP
jgi:hypothetical protein